MSPRLTRALVAALAGALFARAPHDAAAAPSPSRRPADPPSGDRWVRPTPAEAERLYGTLFVTRVSTPSLLAITPEVLVPPFIARDGTRAFFAGGDGGLLQARSIEDGRLLWARRDLGAIGASLAEHRGLLLVGSGSELLALEEATGSERWRVELRGIVSGPLVVTGTVALAPTTPPGVVAIDLLGARVVWRYGVPTSERLALRGEPAPVLDAARGRVYAAFSKGALVALELATGRMLWTTTLGEPQDTLSGAAGPILVEGGAALAVATHARGLVVVGADDGRVRARYPALVHVTSLVPIEKSELALAATSDGEVWKLDPARGRIRWRYRVRRGVPTAPVSAGHGLVAVGSTRGPVALLDQETGRPRQLLAPGSGVSASPAARQDLIAVSSNRGFAVVFRWNVTNVRAVVPYTKRGPEPF